MNVLRSARPRLAAAAGALTAALALVGGAPASVPAQVGDRINVIAGTPTTYPAGQPFHVRHGWGVGATAQPEQAGLWGFQLEVDGAPRDPDAVMRSTDPAPVTAYDYPILNRGWVFNFPEGMTGMHTFTGRWIAPCNAAVDSLGHTGACRTPNERVVAIERSLTVDFVRTNLALGKEVTASSEYPGNPASLAVDGSWWSYWSSGGFPPAWIEVDLGAVQPVGEIDLGITQLPDCQTVHRVYGRADASDPYALLHEFSGFTVDQQVLRYVTDPSRQLRFVKVETTSSCSWVGWREIEVFGAGG
jgi:hypothetical protein